MRRMPLTPGPGTPGDAGRQTTTAGLTCVRRIGEGGLVLAIVQRRRLLSPRFLGGEREPPRCGAPCCAPSPQGSARCARSLSAVHRAVGPRGARRRPGRRHPDGRQRRRLLHLRRGRPLGRQHQRQLEQHRRARLDRVLRQRRRTPARSSTAATAPRRPRSSSAAASNSKNLACSGAKTATDDVGSDFKPGLDFYNGVGRPGPGAACCRTSRRRNNVKMVNLSIGGNDFNFASIVQTCVTDWLHLAVVVEGLLQRRLVGDGELHRRNVTAQDDARSRTRS